MPLLTALLPFYLTDVLDQKVSDLPIVLVPAIVGMLLGLRLVSLFARHHDVAWLGTVGLLGFVAGLLLLAFIDGLDAALGPVMTAGPVDLGPLPDLSSTSQLAMIVALPMGLAFSLVTVAADAVLNARVPPSMQGRVFIPPDVDRHARFPAAVARRRRPGGGGRCACGARPGAAPAGLGLALRSLGHGRSSGVAPPAQRWERAPVNPESLPPAPNGAAGRLLQRLPPFRGGEGPSPPPPPDGSLFRNPRFLRIWISESIAQTTNTALQFVLLILIVEKTNSSIAGSGLILSLAAPPVVFGLFSGVLVDRWDKRTVMFITILARALLTASLLLADFSLVSIYGVAFLTATMGQFYLPAAQASVPTYVSRRQLLSANSLSQTTLAMSQLLGMIMLAPLMLKVFGFDASYVVAAALLLLTLVLIAQLPPVPPWHTAVGETWRQRLRTVPSEMRVAWVAIRSDRLTMLAIVQLSSGGMLLFMFALLVPRFVQDVLNVPPSNAAFIFWPTGVGAVLGLRMLPWLGRRFSSSGLVTVALFGLTGSLAAFGGVNFLVDFLQHRQPFGVLGPDQVGGVSLLIFVTLLIALPLGIAYALVNAPAQTELHLRAPAEMRGRVFAVQLMLANAISMLALLIIGGIADAIGVDLVLFVVAGMTLLLALFSLYMRRGVAAAPPDPPA